ncbi:MAG: gliding motility-associated C-terminal domain-containing protein [Candidatus Latescibacteria bacterium]|nr:gliding motility-associated C-terminal domain-containing protein [Candidatus Latescibacterota bacterium]
MKSRARFCWCWLALLVGGLAAEVLAAPGHTIEGNQIVVKGAAHWQAWGVSAGLVNIDSAGAVSPRFLRKQVNASLDAPHFAVQLEGGAAAGSNPDLARNVIDGDPTTFWEPDLNQSPENWWLQVRLGRVVVVEKIVLRFVGDEQGEPFLEFEVLGWRHPPPKSASQYNLRGTDVARFWKLFRTDRPNKTAREFEVIPRPTEAANPLFAGDPLEVIHILVTDSDLDRTREVSRESYAALPVDARGVVEYYRQSAAGRQSLTTRELYQDLPAAQQGPVRYFRRERPRLAEVEVWTVGDNLSLGATRRGGQTTLQTGAEPKNLAETVTDGDYSTGPSGSIFRGRLNTFFEDLGAVFWVDTLHFLVDGVNPIDEMAIDVSDGARAPDGSIKWTEVSSTNARKDGLLSTGGARYRAFEIAPAKVRFMRALFRNSSPTSYFGFVEVMLYGEGYVAEVELVSDLIELGGYKDLVALEWQAEVPIGTGVELSTRTGNLLEEDKVYHNSDGAVVSEDRYLHRLPRVKQGEVTTVYRPGADWSPWSKPYLFSGDRIQSPSPRLYLQIRARVMADTLSKYGRPASLQSIRVQLADLYADRLLGEVWPSRVMRIGETEERSCAIRPLFSNPGQGFDEVQLTTTAATTLELVEVGRGTEEELLRGGGVWYQPAQLERLAATRDTLWFRLPVPVQRQGEVLQVRMKTAVYANSAEFSAAVKNSAATGSWQRVSAGEALEGLDSQTMVVVALDGNAVFTDIGLASAVVTPNGDGINDALQLSFSLSRLDVARAVRIELFDLSGRRVREWTEERADPRGRYTLAWQGEDQAGRRVPPGLYLLRLAVAAESESAEQTLVTRVVRVVY